ncbi:MAG: hypothetical protein AB7R40_23980 [Nitrospiraceae bacterium]
MQKLITINAATFAVMYDTLNIAYERLIMNNCEHSESPYIAMVNDAITRAEEEL